MERKEFFFVVWVINMINNFVGFGGVVGVSFWVSFYGK